MPSNYNRISKNNAFSPGMPVFVNQKESPWDKASLVSKYCLSFIIPVINRNRKRPLSADELGPPPRVDTSRHLGLRLQQNYNREILSSSPNKEPSFLRAIWRTFGMQLFMIAILDFLAKCVFYPLQTIALGWLIRDATVYLKVAQQEAQQALLNNNLNATTNNLTPGTNVTTTQDDIATTVAGVINQQANGDAITNITSNQAYWRIVIDASLLVIFTIIAVSCSHPYFFQTWHIGMKCRVGACYLVYKKALRLSQSAMSETTVGQMVNILSNDVNRFDQVVQSIPALVIAPLQAIIVVSILSAFYLGLYPTLASLATIVVYILIQTSMGRGFSKFRALTAKRTDERVRLMNEIILAMRIIKMYGWEKPFKQLVAQARKREITSIGIASILRAINGTLFFVSSKIIVFVALITYVILGNSFNPEIVFVSIGLANLVRLSLTLFFPQAISYCAETLISCRRINTFLQLPEIDNSPALYKNSTDGFGAKYVVSMSKVYASWAAKDQDIALSSDSRLAIIRNLSLSIKPRDLVLIVGRVGSGKSSTLMSILGELPLASGRLEVNGRISYASQEAWIFSGTVRQNILFGRAYEPDRYNEVLRVCSLERDMEILNDGDSTIVGERGVSLSGGQKARVNLARALYYDADLYILDDPLSAVDAPVAKHIFNESLRSFLRRKTIVLATHQLQFLRYATKVLVVDRDSPAAFGSLQEVMESEAFAVVNYSKEIFEEASTTDATTTDAEAFRSSSRLHHSSSSRRSSRPTSRQQSTDSVKGSNGKPKSKGSPSTSAQSESPEQRRLSGSNLKRSLSKPEDDSKQQPLTRELGSQASSNLTDSVRVLTPSSMQTSDKNLAAVDDSPPSGSSTGDRSKKLPRVGSSGKVKKTFKSTKLLSNDARRGAELVSEVSTNFQTYTYYLRNATGFIMLIWFILTNVGAQTLFQYTDYFLSTWTDSVQRMEQQGNKFKVITYVDSLTNYEISSIYAILVALTIVATFARNGTFFAGTLRASINMHDKLFKSVVHAPMTFFDFSPIGILLNRFSRDVGFVDENLPATAIEIVAIFVNITGILVLTIIIDYKNSASSIALLVLALLIKKFSGKTIIRLKQIESVTRSPIYSHISTTLSGLATIRAFRVQENFMKIFNKQQDKHSGAWFLFIASGRWLGLCMDWLCMIYISSIVTLLLSFQLDSTTASSVGLLISQAVVISGPFQWGIRQLIETESQMISVQRLKEFSELQTEEETLTIISDDPDANSIEYSLMSSSTLSTTNSLSKFKPDRGEIKFVDVSLSYFSNEPPVLKNLNFIVKSREKIGIVGRTGAGKSSIVSVLFRLYDFEGSIRIDERDTKSLTLSQLRRCMSIIPQDPILFGGSLRKNLDPFNEYQDEDLWAALDAVKLKSLIQRYPQGLEYMIIEGGSNFSVGQRQLICLARAIVRKNKILILDEATANVDPETDVFIQKTISQQFAHCTVITIAHRLITIVDSDKVLVLDAGQLKEFSDPFDLIQDESSIFAQMVNSSAEQAPRIRKLIADEHRKRQERNQESGEETVQ